MFDKSKYIHDSTLKDAWINGLVDAALLLNKRLNQYSFKINVQNQLVTLFGEVNTTIDEWLCLELVKGIKEVKDVSSQLTVVELELLPNASKDFTSRQIFLHWYNDVNTTAEVKAKLQWNSALSGKEIDVSTVNGVVTLSGEVDYVANKAMAELITLQIVPVQEVNNKIVVNG